MDLNARKYGMPDMFTLSFLASPLYSSLTAIKRLINALIPTLNIFITAAFVNTALDILANRASRQAIYGPIALILSVTAYNILSGAADNFIVCRWMILLRRKLRPLMVKKVAKLEYKHIENAKTADLITRVAPTFDTQVREMYQRIMDAAETVLFIAGILITLFTQVWWAALCIITISVPVMMIAVKAGQRSYDTDKEMTKIDRRVNYICGVLRSRDSADERAMYGYTDELNRQYSDQYHFARKFRLKVDISNFIKNKMGGVICSLVAVFTMLAMLKPTASSSINYGMFVGLIGGVMNLSGRLSWGVNWIVQEISRKKEYLKDFTEFMALSEIPDATDLPAKNISFNKIEFDNVSFTYPGTEQPVLNGVSFVIEYGRHYSFVGVNGAGKTTVTKLLTGLYTNYEGGIYVDGRELREFSQAELRALSSVVYQDFARYFLTLYENIAIAMPHDEEIAKRTGVEEAVKLVELTETAAKLKNGMDTQLGKIHEDGVDISDGEWQRAAMARSIVNKAPLCILDEPTAALDPVNESRVYRKFEQISQGRTTVFISHRLGSTKLADIIYVLDKGKIIETGPHADLMAHNGLYAEMFNAQAGWYAQDKETQYA
ncbi:MAG: ABC transporter ATP-binding protein/permease [Treponema sp.]|jgi:ATP-binding cassette subfamily B protein|nr:ABC transporter ATP-binding protein/permease [Treponema sp.]